MIRNIYCLLKHGESRDNVIGGKIVMLISVLIVSRITKRLDYRSNVNYIFILCRYYRSKYN
jgi:hypothetical protein